MNTDRWHVAAFIVILIAFLLRLPLLDGSFWLDEAAQALESARPLSQQLNIAADFQPPFIHLLIHFALNISKAEWWLRTVGALIPGLMTVWITHLIGKKIHSSQLGVLASGLLAISSFHIYYSQELRPYSLPTMWAVLSWWFLLKWLVKKKQNILWYVLATICGLYSSYLYSFLVLAQVLFVVRKHQKQLAKYLAGVMVAGLTFVPWLPSVLDQLRASSEVRAQLSTWETIVSTPQLKTVSMIAAKFIFGVLNVEPSATFLFFTLLILFSSLFLLWSLHKTWKKIRVSSALGFIVIWFFVPLISSWIMSFFIPIVQPKRVLFLLPAFYLGMGVFVIEALKVKRLLAKRVALILLATMVSINIVGTIQYYRLATLHRENWRSLHEQIIHKFGTKKAVAVFAFPEPFAPWRWYDDGTFPTWSTGVLNTDDVTDLDEKLKLLADYDYVLLFDYLRDLSDPNDRLRTGLWSLGYSEVETIDYPNIGFVRVYSRHKPVATVE